MSSSDSTIPKLTPILVRPDVATCADVCAKLRLMFPDEAYDVADELAPCSVCGDEIRSDDGERVGLCDVCHADALADEKADRDYEGWAGK